MLSTFSTQTKKPSKSPSCNFTHSTLAPTNIDAKNVPQKRQPFSTIKNLGGLLTSCHLFLPTDLYQIAEARVNEISRARRYARVNMSLLEVLTGDFFTQHIKIGDVIMRSQGRDGVDFVAQLVDGMLRLEMDTVTYERCGLVGKHLLGGGGQGRTHVKARYVVEFNLRLPSMVRGKKGFERLIYACKNELNRHLTWLFMDMTEVKPSSRESEQSKGDKSPEPIEAFHPTWVEVMPVLTQRPNLQCPLATPDIRTSALDRQLLSDLDYNEELLEWFGLLAINSPRLNNKDKVDPYLCIYDPPPTLHVSNSNQDNMQIDTPTSQDITHLQWSAFMPTSFSTQLFLHLRKTIMEQYGSPASRDLSSWFAISTKSFEGKNMLTCLPGTRSHEGAMDILTWETSG